ncbi:MAG: hypothetical protein ABIO76_08625 [Ginsengibacter sp.]
METPQDLATDDMGVTKEMRGYLITTIWKYNSVVRVAARFICSEELSLN